MDEKLLTVRQRVGWKVRYLRRVLGLTQEQLAAGAGNQPKHIGQVERGQVNVSLDILTRIAACLSVDISELFRRPEDEEKSPDVCVVPRSIVEQVQEAFRALDRVGRTSTAPNGSDAESAR